VYLKVLSILLLFIFFVSPVYSNTKVYECDMSEDVFNSSRACKNEFIANDNRYTNSEIKVIINKESKLIELYVDSKYALSGDLFMSLVGDSDIGLSVGYGNFISEFYKQKKENIDISNVSIGYKILFEKIGLSFYLIPQIGYTKYSIEIAKNGYFLATKIGMYKSVFGINLGIFSNFKKDFIEDITINTMSAGVSLGI